MGPAASPKKIGDSWHGENIPIIIQIKNATYGYIFVLQRLPNLLTRNLAPLNNTIDITESASAGGRTHTK